MKNFFMTGLITSGLIFAVNADEPVKKAETTAITKEITTETSKEKDHKPHHHHHHGKKMTIDEQRAEAETLLANIQKKVDGLPEGTNKEEAKLDLGHAGLELEAAKKIDPQSKIHLKKFKSHLKKAEKKIQ